jgi:dihydrodiol dehydrogenase / D-xylose 1-dehydrogenase (NADP)
MLHQDKILGNISRMFCDFGIDTNMGSLPATSRLKSRELGAGALLDTGIYPLTLSNLVLDGKVGDDASDLEVSLSPIVVDGIDYADAIVVKYPKTERMGILTASLLQKTQEAFYRIEGGKGTIVLSGPGASLPRSMTFA